MVGKESGGESSEGLAGPAKRWDQKSLECGHLTDNVWLSRAVVLRPDCSGRRGGGRHTKETRRRAFYSGRRLLIHGILLLSYFYLDLGTTCYPKVVAT